MNVQEAISYLEKQDLTALEVGRYDVDEDFYFNIQSYETQDISLCKMETHENWVDIQMVLSGVEAIDSADRSRLTVKVPYNDVKDVTFYETPAVMQHTVLTAGAYVVVYPENGHMPKIAVGSPCAVKKCVGKVRIK